MSNEQRRDEHGKFARKDGTNRAMDSTIASNDINTYIAVRESVDNGSNVSYDKTIKKPVLHPTDSLHNKLELSSAEELYRKVKNRKENNLNSAQKKELQSVYASYNRASKDYEKQTQKIASTLNLSSEDFSDQLAYSPASSDLLGSFNASHIPTTDSLEASDTTTDDEKIALAKTFLRKVRTENKFKALISSYLVENRKAVKL
jgi:hypothetical protein